MGWTGVQTTWLLGAVLLVAGIAYGIYWGQTAEGLAALGGVVLVMMSVAAGTLITTGATVWSARRGGLPSAMIIGTAVVGALALGMVLFMLAENGPIAWMVLLGLLGIAAIVATGWAVSARPTS